MKNIQFTSRRTDLKIVAAVVLATWLLTSLFENIHSEPFVVIDHVKFFDAIISVPLAFFVWCLFHLARPSRYAWRYSRKWVIAEWTVVPIVWMLLMLAFNAWVHHLWSAMKPFWEGYWTLQ